MIEGALLDKLVGAAVDTWEAEVRREGDQADWLPKVALVSDAGEVLFLVLGGEGSTAEMVMAALGEFVTPETACAAITVDTYMSVDHEALDLVLHHPTATLSSLFEAGHPGVVEALCIMVADRAGTQQMVRRPYLRVGRTVEWLADVADVPQQADFGGRLAEALVQAMTKAGN
jgi:hypothetical protein